MLTEAVLGVVLLVLLLTLVNRRPKGLPPGEWGWPVLGALMPSGVTIEDHLKTLRRKYGDIFTRRFALRQLKELGMGKSSLMDAIQYEVTCLVDDFMKHTGRPQPIPMSLNVAILNVIWKITADIRYDVDDRKVHEFNDLITELFENFQRGSVIFDMYPWLPSISPPFLTKYLGVDALLESVEKLRVYILQVMGEHEASLNPDKPRDYIDIYLIEMKAQQGNPESTMSKLDLCAQVADLFTAGSETTNQTMRWGLLFLAKYPDVQARVQQQIDDVVPRGTLPSLEDKPKLTQLEAVIHEISRLVSLVPLGLSHAAAADTQLAGFTIPKGTVIIPNQEMCHKEPTYWEKPEEFYPEHFLDSEGKLKPRKKNYLPFSIGRRVCPGEALSRMELYLFLSALLQNFTFSEPEGEPLDLKRNPNALFFNLPKPQNIVITKRA
ncbi:Cytochrome P450 2L1-like 4 [Homarus americanus]|uniref:Cytochrome P450 2L1-like 4 n=1 Tax=Homarus americanus TaxID=6706 RepID=A0A8J5JIN3_HOMAM|nr:Cytochrome P450 2L1-like 4 [Homarus americanus]